MCGTMDPDIENACFIPENDLSVNMDGEPCLILRLKNCTGNLIDLTNTKICVDDQEISRGQVALSIDYHFKNQRSRTIA